MVIGRTYPCFHDDPFHQRCLSTTGYKLYRLQDPKGNGKDRDSHHIHSQVCSKNIFSSILTNKCGKWLLYFLRSKFLKEELLMVCWKYEIRTPQYQAWIFFVGFFPGAVTKNSWGKMVRPPHRTWRVVRNPGTPIYNPFKPFGRFNKVEWLRRTAVYPH